MQSAGSCFNRHVRLGPFIGICSLLALLAPVVASFGGTHQVPDEEPIIKIQIPDKWKVREIGESLEATTGDGAAHVLVTPVEEKKVAESLGEAIRYVRNTGGLVIRADSVKHDTAQVKDKRLHTVTWDATAKDQPVKIRCYIIEGAEGKRVVLVFWGSLEAEKKYRSHLDKILESVEPA